MLIRPTPPARSGRFVQLDQPDLGRPVLFAKIFRFTSDPNHLHIPRHPGPHKGAFRDRHGRRVGMRWTRVALLTRALTLRTAKSCGPDASMVGVKFVMMLRITRAMVTKSPITRESAK